MASLLSFSEHSGFNFTHSPSGPLSPRESIASHSSLNLSFFFFDLLFLSEEFAPNPPPQEGDQVLLEPGEEIIPLQLFEDMLEESMSSDAEGVTFSASFGVPRDMDRRMNLALTTPSENLSAS